MKRILLSAMAGGLVLAQSASAVIIYVNAANTGGPWAGTAWSNAFRTVTEGLTAAASNGQVWVAQGTYTPTAGNRTNSFFLKSGVALYGGFAGSETSLAQRDWTGHPTILSGDIGIAGVSTDNCYHVVTGVNGAEIDGFTITGGYANGPGPGAGGGQHTTQSNVVAGVNHGTGGGILNYMVAPAVRNCLISGNYAQKGGGAYNMVTTNWPSPVVMPAPSFLNVTFSNNTCVARGGGVSDDLLTHPVYTSCRFISNQCTQGKGGALYNDFGCSPQFQNCLFAGNYALESGGAMGNDGSSSPTLIHCTITDNLAGDQGGGLYQGTYGADTDTQNSPVLIDCILASNRVSTVGPTDLSNWAEDNPTLLYTLIPGGYEGAGNFDVPPRFVSPATCDYRLSDASQAIDAGVPTGVTNDLAGARRPVDGNRDGYTTADPGCFEYAGTNANTAAVAWRFAFVGDTHYTDNPTYLPEIAASVIADNAKVFIIGGDLVAGGSNKATATLTTELTNWRTAMTPVYSNGIKVLVIRGNHEDDVTNDLVSWNSVFTGAYAMPTNGPAGETNLTYTFAYSNVLFVGLDVYANIHRVNQSWLDQQFAGNRLPHVFPFGHEAAFKVFHTDCLDDYPTERDTFWRSLATAGAKVYLCGHDHFLDTARIDDGDGDPTDDVYQYVVGTGGGPAFSNQSYNGSNNSFTPVNTGHEYPYGYLLVEISGTGTNDLGVTMQWKQRTYNNGAGIWQYLPTTNLLRYTAVNLYADSVGDGILNGWRRLYFGGSGTSTGAVSMASADADGDGTSNLAEFLAGTDPTNGTSRLALIDLQPQATGFQVVWTGGTSVTQIVETRSDLASTGETWRAIATNPPPCAVTNWLLWGDATASNACYRIRVSR